MLKEEEAHLEHSCHQVTKFCSKEETRCVQIPQNTLQDYYNFDVCSDEYPEKFTKFFLPVLMITEETRIWVAVVKVCFCLKIVAVDDFLTLSSSSLMWLIP